MGKVGAGAEGGAEGGSAGRAGAEAVQARRTEGREAGDSSTQAGRGHHTKKVTSGAGAGVVRVKCHACAAGVFLQENMCLKVVDVVTGPGTSYQDDDDDDDSAAADLEKFLHLAQLEWLAKPLMSWGAVSIEDVCEISQADLETVTPSNWLRLPPLALAARHVLPRLVIAAPPGKLHPATCRPSRL